MLQDFIKDLAAHEGRPELATVSVAKLEALLFGPEALGRAYLVVQDGAFIAYSIVAERFSSFRGTRVLYIEDMLVRPAFQGGGTGKKLLSFLAGQAISLGCERLEWSALDNNDSALGFYDHIGAAREEGVVHFSLRGHALKMLAGDDGE